MTLIIRLAVGVTTLALLSTIPAAGQTTAPSKLSPQQLNPATLNVNKRIAAPNKPITVLTPTANSLNWNKQLAAPRAYSPNRNQPIAATPPKGTLAFKRPVPCPNMRYSNSPNAGGLTAAALNQLSGEAAALSGEINRNQSPARCCIWPQKALT